MTVPRCDYPTVVKKIEVMSDDVGGKQQRNENWEVQVLARMVGWACHLSVYEHAVVCLEKSQLDYV